MRRRSARRGEMLRVISFLVDEEKEKIKAGKRKKKMAMMTTEKPK